MTYIIAALLIGYLLGQRFAHKEHQPRPLEPNDTHPLRWPDNADMKAIADRVSRNGGWTPGDLRWVAFGPHDIMQPQPGTDRRNLERW